MSDYLEFLRAKIKMAAFSGFEIAAGGLHSKLFHHQRDIVAWAVKGGNRAIFASCGLGTVPYRAILKGRRGGGSELNPAYFMDQVHYLKSAEQQVSMPSLFDALEVVEEAQAA